MNEAADLYLQYGRTTEALLLFRQIGDAHLIAHCLLIHARTKLYIHSDGSARYINNENEKVEIYLEDAIQLFKKRNRHDNVKGDLNTAIGEANLLLGKLSGHQKYIGFAFQNFEKRKPYRNEAGQLECLNWMIKHSRLENELLKVIFGMENMFNVIRILVTSHSDLAKRNRMEQILQNFGLHLEMNVVSYNPRHNPSILKLLEKEEYPAILTKQDVRREISLERARHAIIAYLLSKGQQWHHRIVTVLEKETTCLRKSDISQIAVKDLFRFIQLDVLYGQLEYFLDEGIQSVKGYLKKDERQVIDTYIHQISSFSQCRLLIDDVLCVIPHLRDNTKLKMELYFARGFIGKYFKHRLSKLMNRFSKMRYQSIAYFVELITCHRIFALKNNIYADLAKLENTIGTECLKGETRRNDLRRMGFILQRGKERVIFISKVRPFLYSIQELTKINGIFGALKEFKRFVCFMKEHEIQLTFSETTLLLHWLQYYIYVGFSLQSKCSYLRHLELEFIIPSTFLSSVKLVDSLIFCNSNFSTGTMIANFTSKTIPKYGEISGIVERCIEYLVGNIMKTAFKHLLECMPINESQTLLDITNEVETVMCLCMVFIINMGKIIFEKTETRILGEIALINIPKDSPEKIVRLMKGIKSASGIADIYNHLSEVLKSKGEKLLKLKWDAKQKKIAECNFISDLKNGFHLPVSIKTLSDPEKIPEQNIDESESEKVEFTADEIKSTEEDHEKIVQVVENTEQSHAANVEPKHEKAHSDESLKGTFFPECLVTESRCDICGEIFQPDTVDLGEDDGSEYLSDFEQHDTLSLPRSTIVPIRSLSSTSDEIKLSKDLEQHISSGLHKSNKEKYDRFKKYYYEKVKSGLEEVDQFIQEYQLDSPNVTKIYGNDDFRINAFVTSFKECKTKMVKLVKTCQWTDRNTGEAIHKVTKQMEKLNASVKDAFRTHTQVSLNKLSV